VSPTSATSAAATAPARPAPLLRPLTAQTGAEIYMTLRRGETLLLTIGIPCFLSSSPRCRSSPRRPPTRPTSSCRAFLALAVMSTAMVSLGIATGFRARLRPCSSGSAPRRSAARACSERRSSPSSPSSFVPGGRPAPVGLALGWNPGGSAGAAIAGAIGRDPARLGRLRRHRVGHGRTLRAEVNLARPTALPDPAAPRRHDRSHRQARNGLADLRSCCQPGGACPPRCTPASAAARPSPPSPGSSWRCGRSRAPVAAALTFRWE